MLYFQNEKKLYFDLTKTKMENIVSTISSKIIFAHMSDTALDISQFLDSNEYKISFYDKNKNKMFGNLDEKIDLSQKIITQDKNFILINSETYGHLGVYYIAIEENLYFKTIDSLKQNILLLFFLIFSFLALVGFYLAKLFLKPIKDEREKLNNFIKDTTHELNTPISAILMSSEGENLSKKQVERIKLAAKRISEVYMDLTFIFLEEQDSNINIETLFLDEVIKEQLEYFSVLAEKKGISLEYELDNVKYEIDRNDFIRLFNNILSNAIKYNKKSGSVNIILKADSLLVKDTGIGIAQDKLKDIFNRYQRATTQEGGFGIGLNIVQNICKKYNISFDVNSVPHNGSSFIFKFN